MISMVMLKWDRIRPRQTWWDIVRLGETWWDLRLCSWRSIKRVKEDKRAWFFWNWREVSRAVLKDLCEEGWQKLLEELDSDNDGKISLSEFEALRTRWDGEGHDDMTLGQYKPTNITKNQQFYREYIMLSDGTPAVQVELTHSHMFKNWMLGGNLFHRDVEKVVL